ncbi:hypothetical protein E1B03_14590 [Citrobacter arsenatis]|uniref:Uncharacterized protein n=1 Tax=Citrobacter arsenatis TaxID=2546350 RepID=A0A4P6WP40_9ENTR|nr:hypothetical protein [Citrobacter arsenatis]QBM23592.1 hypothetical protein E1B03_14590 [Citrobacter arsenatis]
MIVNEEFVFQTSTVHPGERFYVVNALRGDQPVDENGYLVMVNECGDRVAYRAPGNEWQRDAMLIAGYNTLIPMYKNAIKIAIPPLENE